MLEDEDGRWARLGNQDRFLRHASQMLGALDTAGLLPDGLALDLEPPIGELRRAVQGSALTAVRWAVRRTRPSLYGRFVEEASSLGLETVAAVIPAVLADRSGDGWQRALDTPVADLRVDAVSPMAYSSLFEGYSRGMVRRRDAAALVGAIAHATVRQYGARASLSLGVVGRGAMGDEQCFRSVDELAEDVAAARSAGIEDLALFNLGGVLARGPAEAWLDALVSTPARAPSRRPTLRAWALTAGVVAGSRAFSALASLRASDD
jgi:hypothetical protein